MNVLESVGFGLALGFSLTVPPGPMNALIAAVSARSFRAGVVAGLGAMSADGILGAIVLSFSTVVDLASVVRAVDAVGAVALAYFGVRLLRSRDDPAPAAAADARTYSRALALGVSNPFQIVWWLTAGLAFVRLGGGVLLAGLFGAIAVWIVVFPWALHAGARRSPTATRGIVIASAAIMLGFAAYFAILAA